MTELAVLQSLYSGHSTSAEDERRAAAREALAQMKGDQGWVAEIDSRSLDFLATEISEQMMHELARRWVARTMGYPTSANLAVVAERLHLEGAVAALDTSSGHGVEMNSYTR